MERVLIPLLILFHPPWLQHSMWFKLFLMIFILIICDLFCLLLEKFMPMTFSIRKAIKKYFSIFRVYGKRSKFSHAPCITLRLILGHFSLRIPLSHVASILFSLSLLRTQ